MALDPDVLRYYERGGEADRLVRDGVERLELLRTKELLLRRLGPAPVDVLDVGGASGRYAAWLSELGHRVHLVDPVPLHVEQATAIAAGRFAVSPGDARSLPFDGASVDVVLLLGPLYHLVERDDRLQALREAWRVLRPGGWIAAAASRYASALDGIAKGHAADPAFRAGVRTAVATGVHRSRGTETATFTTAYFHHPEELRAEIGAAGFTVEDVFGVEGPGGYQADDGPAWRDPAFREDMLALARSVETEPSLLGFGPHLLAFGTR